MDLAIIGSGYVGLVTAACLAHLGHRVTCIDIDQHRVERLVGGEVPIIEPGLDDFVADGLARGRLAFSTEAARAAGSELIIVCCSAPSMPRTNGPRRSSTRRCMDSLQTPRSRAGSSSAAPCSPVQLAPWRRTCARSIHGPAHDPEFTREATAVADFLAPDRVIIGVDDVGSDPAADRLADAVRRVYRPLAAPTLVTDLTSAETDQAGLQRLPGCEDRVRERAVAALRGDRRRRVRGRRRHGHGRAHRAQLPVAGPGIGGSCSPSQARALPELAREHGVRVPLMEAVWPSNLVQGEWLLDGVEGALGRTSLASAWRSSA